MLRWWVERMNGRGWSSESAQEREGTDSDSVCMFVCGKGLCVCVCGMVRGMVWRLQ